MSQKSSAFAQFGRLTLAKASSPTRSIAYLADPEEPNRRRCYLVPAYVGPISSYRHAASDDDKHAVVALIVTLG